MIKRIVNPWLIDAELHSASAALNIYGTNPEEQGFCFTSSENIYKSMIPDKATSQAATMEYPIIHL